MINLKLKANFSWSGPPFVARISNTISTNDDLTFPFKKDELGNISVHYKSGIFSFLPPQADDFEGDVLLCDPKSSKIQRIFRANSNYNSLLMTERCDQMCVMCSQPPRKTNDAWRFPIYEQALTLASQGATICLSGGEPTLYKAELFTLLENLSSSRPDLKIHILSNCQHLTPEDIPRLQKIHESLDVLWGIPIYASKSEIHEDIVDKHGSFNILMNNLYLLASSKANIELRTVVMATNSLELPDLSKFISDHLDFANYWAIMALEPVGFAKANLGNLLYDHSIAPQPIHKAIDIAVARGVDVRLFNFPLCTVGPQYRKYCKQSISDWKRKYLDICGKCTVKEECTGFFEWYDERSKWERISQL